MDSKLVLSKVAVEGKLMWQGFLDLLYPPHCLICQATETDCICECCYGAFLPIPEPVCYRCGHPAEARDCPVCQQAELAGGWGFDAARAAGIYQGPLREAIHRLKFQNLELLGEPLGHYLAAQVTVEHLLDGCLPSGESYDGIVPLPLHPAKQRRRGYNQSALIAAPLADMMNVACLEKTLTRPRKSQAQVGLTGQARRNNISESSFIVRDVSQIAGKNVILVDDVFTTGTTLSAAARTLKASGAAHVTALALAAGG